MKYCKIAILKLDRKISNMKSFKFGTNLFCISLLMQRKIPTRKCRNFQYIIDLSNMRESLFKVEINVQICKILKSTIDWK